MSQKPLPFSTYPPALSGGRSPVNSAPGSANQVPETGQDRRIQAEIEAERLWWSEVSERQVQELESSFEEEFKKTTEKLRSDIARCQDRLELLVESERKQRQAETTEVKREMSALQDSVRGIAERPTIVAQSPPEFLSMRKDIDDLRTMLSARITSLQAEWEQSKTQSKSSDDLLVQLQKEFNLQQENHQVNMSQIQDLRRDLTSMTERTQLMAQANEEVHQLHQVIMQQASGREEELATASAALEQKLRQELESTRRMLEANDTKMRSELLETVASSSRQLQQSLADEREKRSLEANVLRTKLDSTVGRLVDTEVLVRTELQKNSLEAPAPAVVEDDALRSLLDTLRRDFSRLEEDVVSDRAAQTGSHDRLRNQMAEGLADERKNCISSIDELRKHLEDMVRRLRTDGGRSGGMDNSNGALVETTSIQDLHDLRSEVSSLKANLHVVDSECRRSVASSSRVESEMLDLEGQVRKSVALLPRVDALEEICRKHTAVARKVEALEGESRPDTRKLEVEMRRALHDIVPIASRLDVMEAEISKGNTRPRLEVAETEIQSIRASMALAVDVSGIQSEMREVAAGLVSLKKTLGEVANRKPTFSSVVPQATAAAQAAQRGRSNSVQRGHVKVAAFETRTPVSVEQQGQLAVQQGQVQQAQLPLPSLSSDLKESIEQLVYKVNKTLTKPGDPPQVVAGNIQAPQGATEEALHKAVIALREKNLHLREGNAEIVEELLDNEGLLTPNSMPEGPPLLDQSSQSKASSCIPTPSQQHQPTAQFASGIGLRNMNQPFAPALAQRQGRNSNLASHVAPALRQTSPQPPTQPGLLGTYPSAGRPSAGSSVKPGFVPRR